MFIVFDFVLVDRKYTNQEAYLNLKICACVRMCFGIVFTKWNEKNEYSALHKRKSIEHCQLYSLNTKLKSTQTDVDNTQWLNTEYQKKQKLFYRNMCEKKITINLVVTFNITYVNSKFYNKRHFKMKKRTMKCWCCFFSSRTLNW